MDVGTLQAYVSDSDPFSPALDLAKASGMDVSEFALVHRRHLRALLRFLLARRSRLPTSESPVSDAIDKVTKATGE